MQAIVYTNSTTPRLQYIISVLFNALGIQQYAVTLNASEFTCADAAKINYSHQPVAANECWIVPSNLLFEKEVKPQQITAGKWDDLPVFFTTTAGDVPFDLLAASFFLLSRYEEYLPHDPDEYGRYAHVNSLAFKQGFLQQPLVNNWVVKWRVSLLQKFPSLTLNPPIFQYRPTYDIDMAWSYFNKGLLRNAAGLARSLFKLEFNMAKERVLALLDLEDDPCDIYEWLDALHQQHALSPIYFFLMAARPGVYDKNVSPRRSYFQLLLRKLSVMYAIGIHPSWQSGDDASLVKSEKNSLENITDKNIDNSRQHYIRMQLPTTYQQLIAAGINNDYSMGYGSINGFRASYCLPYKWYDLTKEEPTDLTIFPFCYMEANSQFEQKLTTEQALQELQQYYLATKKVNGLFVTIFHNHLLTLQPGQVAWRQMYESFLKQNF